MKRKQMLSVTIDSARKMIEQNRLDDAIDLCTKGIGAFYNDSDETERDKESLETLSRLLDVAVSYKRRTLMYDVPIDRMKAVGLVQGEEFPFAIVELAFLHPNGLCRVIIRDLL